MYLEKIFFNYKLGRFFFSFALLFAFAVFAGEFKFNYTTFPYAAVILFFYTLTSFFTIYIKKINTLDFLLDISFLSALIFIDFDSMKYFSVLYLLVLFFAGLILKPFCAYVVSFVTFIIYALLFFLNWTIMEGGLINLLLNGFAFGTITYAGTKVREKIQFQEGYIKSLEREKQKAEIYRKLYRISAELAHEIRNPLASIHGAAQLLTEGRVDAKLVNIIKNESERLNELLKEFLLLSKPRENNERFINVKEILNQIIQLCKDKGKNIELHIDNEPLIYFDEREFYSGISNILRNAVEWANSRIIIKGFYEDNMLIIEVEDDGEGVKQEDKERIFEPFYTKRKTGTGLGLAIAKRVFVENGGNIFVDDSELGGAKFIIHIPIKRGENESSNSRRRKKYS
ncbi:two-component system sensor histidine kinase NtrB [Persephonella sp.]